VRFGTEVEYIMQKYAGVSDLVDHVGAETYEVQFRRRNGSASLYILWIKFLITGTWN
jgi:hypothetical protein